MEKDTYFLPNYSPPHEFYSPNAYQINKPKKPLTKSLKYKKNYQTSTQQSPGNIVRKYVQESYDPEGNRVITTKIIRELNEPNILENRNRIICHNEISSAHNSKKISPSPYASPIIVQENDFQASPIFSENYEVQNSFDNNFNQSGHFNQESFRDNEYNYYGNISKNDRNLGSSVSRGASSDFKSNNKNEQLFNSQSDFIDQQKSYEINKNYPRPKKIIMLENDDDYNDYIRQGKIKIHAKNTMNNLQSNTMAKSMRINKKNQKYVKKDFQTPDRGDENNIYFRGIKSTMLKPNGPTNDDMKVTKKMRNQINNTEESLTKSNNNYKTKFNSARIIQAWWRNMMERNEIYDIIVKKAIKLQSFIRGYLVRKKVLRYVTLAIYYQSFCDKLQDVLCVHVKNEILKLFREKFGGKDKLLSKNNKKILNNKNNGKIQSQIIIGQKGKNLIKKIISNKPNKFKKIKTTEYFNIWKNAVFPSALKRVIINKILNERKLILISVLQKWKLISTKIKKQVEDTKRYFYRTNVSLSREIRSRSMQKSLRNNINLSSSYSPGSNSYKNIFSSHQRNFTLSPIRVNNIRPYQLFKSPAGTNHFYGGEACVRYIKNRKYKEIICTSDIDRNITDETNNNKKYTQRNQIKRVINVTQNGQYNNKTNKSNNIKVIPKSYKTNNLRNLNTVNISNENYEDRTFRNNRHYTTNYYTEFLSPSYDRKIKYIRIVDKYCPIHGWLCPIHGVKVCPIHGSSSSKYKNYETRNMTRSYNNIYDANRNLNNDNYDYYYTRTNVYSRSPRFDERPTNKSITFGNRSEMNDRLIFNRYKRKNSIDNRLSVSIIKLPEKKQKVDKSIKVEETKFVHEEVRDNKYGKKPKKTLIKVINREEEIEQRKLRDKGKQKGKIKIKPKDRPDKNKRPIRKIEDEEEELEELEESEIGKRKPKDKVGKNKRPIRKTEEEEEESYEEKITKKKIKIDKTKKPISKNEEEELEESETGKRKPKDKFNKNKKIVEKNVEEVEESEEGEKIKPKGKISKNKKIIKKTEEEVEESEEREKIKPKDKTDKSKKPFRQTKEEIEEISKTIKPKDKTGKIKKPVGKNELEEEVEENEKEKITKKIIKVDKNKKPIQKNLEENEEIEEIDKRTKPKDKIGKTKKPIEKNEEEVEENEEGEKITKKIIKVDKTKKPIGKNVEEVEESEEGEKIKPKGKIGKTKKSIRKDVEEEFEESEGEKIKPKDNTDKNIKPIQKGQYKEIEENEEIITRKNKNKVDKIVKPGEKNIEEEIEESEENRKIKPKDKTDKNIKTTEKNKNEQIEEIEKVGKRKTKTDKIIKPTEKNKEEEVEENEEFETKKTKIKSDKIKKQVGKNEEEEESEKDEKRKTKTKTDKIKKYTETNKEEVEGTEKDDKRKIKTKTDKIKKPAETNEEEIEENEEEIEKDETRKSKTKTDKIKKQPIEKNEEEIEENEKDETKYIKIKTDKIKKQILKKPEEENEEDETRKIKTKTDKFKKPIEKNEKEVEEIEKEETRKIKTKTDKFKKPIQENDTDETRKSRTKIDKTKKTIEKNEEEIEKSEESGKRKIKTKTDTIKKQEENEEIETRKIKTKTDKIQKPTEKNEEEELEEEEENEEAEKKKIIMPVIPVKESDKGGRNRKQKVKEQINKPVLVDKGINPETEENEIFKLSQINFYGSKPEMFDEGIQKNDYTNYTNNSNVTKSTNEINKTDNKKNVINVNNGMSEEDVQKYHLLLENVEKDRLEKLYNKLYTIVIKKIYKDLFNKKNAFDKWKNNVLTSKTKDDKIQIILSKLLYKKIMGDKLRLSNALRKWNNVAKHINYTNLNIKNKKMNFLPDKNQDWKIIEKKPKQTEVTSKSVAPVKIINKKENVLNIQVINKKKLKDESITANFANRFKSKDFIKTQKSFEIKIKKQKQRSPVIKPSFNENQICLHSQKYLFEKEVKDGKHHPITEENWKKIYKILPIIISKKDNKNSILEKYLKLWLRNAELLKCCQSAKIIQSFFKKVKKNKISKKWRSLARKYILKNRLYLFKFKKVIDLRKKKIFDLIRITRLNLIFSRRKYLHYILLCWKIYTRNIKQKRKNLKFMYENMLNTYMHMADDIFGSNQKENPSVQDALFEVLNSSKFQVNNMKDVPIAETYYSQKKEETKIDNTIKNIPYITKKEIEIKSYKTYTELLKKHPFSQFKEEIKDNKSLSRRNMQSSSKSPENSGDEKSKRITVSKEQKSDDDYSNKKSSNDEAETKYKVYKRRKYDNSDNSDNSPSEKEKIIQKKIEKIEKIEEKIPVKNIGYRKRKINVEYSPENEQQEEKSETYRYSRRNKPQTEKKEIIVEEPIYQKTEIKGGSYLSTKKKTETSNDELEDNKAKKEINIFSRRRRSPLVGDNENDNKGIVETKTEEKDFSGYNKAAKMYKSRRVKEGGSDSDKK